MALALANDPAIELDLRISKLRSSHRDLVTAYTAAREAQTAATVAELLGEPRQAGNPAKLAGEVARLERELRDVEAILDRTTSVARVFAAGQDAKTFDEVARNRLAGRAEWAQIAKRQVARVKELQGDQRRLAGLEVADAFAVDLQRELSARSKLGRRPVDPIAGALLIFEAPSGTMGDGLSYQPEIDRINANIDRAARDDK